MRCNLEAVGYNSRVTSGFATRQGTERFTARFHAPCASGFYRTFDGVKVSTIGLGTYLGNPDGPTDQAYRESVGAAVRGGLNFLDTAINYRNMRSEQSIGAALSDLLQTGDWHRDELVVATKAGFLTPGAVPSFLKPDDVVGGMHSMEPRFIADQIDRSRSNLGLETIDIFYLHNPETQLNFVSRDEFDRRIALAFAALERMVAEGKIRYYGTATWEGYRRPGGAKDTLDLVRLVEIAQEQGGPQHHFRWIQLPLNLAMVEAFANRVYEGDGDLSVLDVAARSQMAVVASASLLQAKLSCNLPEGLVSKFGSLKTDAQRAIQFTRSTPGITVALVGMSKTAHVSENLALAKVSPMTEQQYAGLYQTA